MSEWKNEVQYFDLAEDDHGIRDLIVAFKDDPQVYYYRDLGPERKMLIDETVSRILALDFSPDTKGDVEIKAGVALCDALNTILRERNFAPKGMSFPVGLYSQPVPNEVAHLWHNADGTQTPAQQPDATGGTK